MKEKVILFDLDGTLIDSTEAIINSFYFSFSELKFKFKGNEEDIKSLIGYPLDIMYENLGVPKNDVKLFVDTYKEKYRTISLSKTLLLPYAKEALELASKFARLGIVTTKTTQYSIPLLQEMGILDYFETIIGRQEVENPKPHPEPILKAIEMMKITQDDFDIYMIGDTKLDLIAANEAKINSIGVLCGYGAKDELLKYTTLVESNSFQAVKKIENIKN